MKSSGRGRPWLFNAERRIDRVGRAVGLVVGLARDLETGIDVGWRGNGTDVADPDGFGNFGVLTGDAVAEFRPVAGIFLPFTNIIQDAGFKTFAAETTVAITITGAAATLTAGYIKVIVLFVGGGIATP